jgi:NAD(P)-dependent dehydrogenase (short-subunit alcohol dehydrogenase family)
MTEIGGRTAFITGGANGIGLGIARAFAKEGAKLALADLDVEALGRARDELAKITAVETVVLDVRDRVAYARAADAVEQALGPVSLLFNNAGVAGGAPIDRMTYEMWDWGLGINLYGVINGVQTFLPRMVERGAGGHILITSSGAGLAATGSGVLYHTAKFAVVGLAEALAPELASSNIGVSVLCPGAVATDIVARTRKMQPRVNLSDAQRQAGRALNARNTTQLANGTSPDAVGEWVLAAVRKNQLYIHTCAGVAPFVEARTKALLDAMPPPHGSANESVKT